MPRARRPSPATLHLPLDPAVHAPSQRRPVRARIKPLQADAQVVPHRHPWAQLTFSTTGVVRVHAGDHSFIVPPSRAVWIPAGTLHRVTVIEQAQLCTLYLLEPPPGQALRAPAWPHPQALEISPLLRELLHALAALATDRPGGPREQHLGALVLDELSHARALPLGVALPADRRLRALCEAVLRAPGRHARLDDWALESGASPRTVARLFRRELGTSFGAWRQQAMLASAVGLAAQRRPIAHVASELGYASTSAFSAMVRRTLGVTPRQLLRGQPLPLPPSPD